jgi:hypothetical protein
MHKYCCIYIYILIQINISGICIGFQQFQRLLESSIKVIWISFQFHRSKLGTSVAICICWLFVCLRIFSSLRLKYILKWKIRMSLGLKPQEPFIRTRNTKPNAILNSYIHVEHLASLTLTACLSRKTFTYECDLSVYLWDNKGTLASFNKNQNYMTRWKH